MTKLKRFTGKVFGGSATAVGDDPQIAQFGSALANTFVGTTDPEIIQQLPAWGQGWIGAVTPTQQYPTLPEMTGAMKVLSHQICGILQQGVSTWDSGTIYYTGNFVSLNGKLYVSQIDENQGNNPTTDTTNWQEFSSGGGGGQYIGQTIFSLDPLIEDELHLLDGAILQVGGIYDQFINEYIANLYTTNPERFCTEQQWQSAISTYGVCGKYVYNAGVSVRLPKVGNYLNSTSTSSTAPVIGNGKCLGLNDGTYQYGFYENSNNVISTSLNLYGANVGTAQTSAGSASNLKGIGVTTIPNYSGLVANLSNITQPLEGYYYIVVATGSKTDIEVDIDNIATDLNSKADVSLSNTTPSTSFKANSASWCLPNYSKAIYCATLPYTAPANGWIIGVANISGSTDLYLYIDGKDIAKENDDYCDVCVPISKGQILTASSTIEASRNLLYFYPMKGNG